MVQSRPICFHLHHQCDEYEVCILPLNAVFFFSFFHLVCLKWQMDPGVNFIIIVVDIMYKNIFIHVTINK